MPLPSPPPIAVARVVVGGASASREPDEAPAAARPVVLTLYRQPDGDGTYSIVMHRGVTAGRR